MNRALACAALSLVAGCLADQVTCVCAPVTASVSEAWAGSPVVFTSAAFSGADTLPVRVMSGSDSLIFIALQNNQIAVLMPQLDGAYALEVTLHSGEVLTTDDVRVHGFLGFAEGPLVSGRVQPAIGYPNPSGMAYGPNGRLAVFNLKTGGMQLLGTTRDVGFGNGCLPGVIPSAANPLVTTVGRRRSGNVCSVLAATVGSTVSILDSTTIIGNGTNPSIHLGAGRWIVGRSNDIAVVTGPGISYSYPCGSLQDIVAAPSPGIAVVLVGCIRSGGVPVLDRTSGLPQFVLAGTRQVSAAAFSPYGDTLYVAAFTDAASPQSVLYAVDPVTGAVFDEVALPALREITDMTVDPNGRWLYLVDGGKNLEPLEIKVFDRATLDYVAIWHAPNSMVTHQLWLWRLIVGADRVLYLIGNAYAPTRGSLVLRWALMN